MSKYIDADKLIAEIERFSATEYDGNTLGDDVANSALDFVIKEIIPSLQQEHEIVELSFKGGTYRVNGEENTFKGGKAKIIILEVNQEEENV